MPTSPLLTHFPATALPPPPTHTWCPVPHHCVNLCQQLSLHLRVLHHTEQRPRQHSSCRLVTCTHSAIQHNTAGASAQETHKSIMLVGAKIAVAPPRSVAVTPPPPNGCHTLIQQSTEGCRRQGLTHTDPPPPPPRLPGLVLPANIMVLRTFFQCFPPPCPSQSPPPTLFASQSPPPTPHPAHTPTTLHLR